MDHPPSPILSRASRPQLNHKYKRNISQKVSNGGKISAVANGIIPNNTEQPIENTLHEIKNCLETVNDLEKNKQVGLAGNEKAASETIQPAKRNVESKLNIAQKSISCVDFRTNVDNDSAYYDGVCSLEIILLPRSA